ncbi:MAG: PQQ-binding-like beta-propeller repeat protein, partial [bacterium]
IKLLRLENGAEIWEREFPFVVNCAGSKERVFIAGLEKLFCVDAFNGETIWQLPLKSPPSVIAIENRTVFLGSIDGEVIKISPEGDVQWSSVVDHNPISYIALDDNLLVLSIGTRVSILSREGRKIYNWHLGREFKNEEKGEDFWLNGFARKRECLYV